MRNLGLAFGQRVGEVKTKSPAGECALWTMPETSKVYAKRAATLSDVGRLAGVSAMAVSTVLNKTKTSTRISEETQKRIREAALKLNYRPNMAARALVSRRMNTIGVSVVFLDGELNHYFLELFNGIIEGAAHRGQNTTVFTLDSWNSLESMIDRSCDGRIDGMIFIGPVIEDSRNLKLPSHTPYVSLHANSRLPGTVNVESDEETGACEMVRHLISLGHQDILLMGGPHGLVGSQRRVDGYRKALREAGIAENPERILETNGFTQEGGYEMMTKWLEMTPRESLPSAIFCANDAIAVGCMEALAGVGIRVPDDISLCGFDDTLVARTTVPQLTTVRQPLREMGSRAVDILLKRIDAYQMEGPVEPDPSVIFPTELVLRDSTAPIQK